MENNNGVKWAADRVIRMAEKAGKDIETETLVEYKRGKEVVTFGYLDAYFTGHLFDLKTGMERDYVPQLLVYAAALCRRDDLDRMNVYLLYSESHVVSHMEVTREVAEEVTNSIIDRVEDITKLPSQCSYCKWCADKTICPANNPERLHRCLSNAVKNPNALDRVLSKFMVSMRLKDKEKAKEKLLHTLSLLTKQHNTHV